MPAVKKGTRWTAAELAAVMTTRDMASTARRLGRPLGTCMQQRLKAKRRQAEDGVEAVWTPAERELLRRWWPKVSHPTDITKHLPTKTYLQCANAAGHYKIRRLSYRNRSEYLTGNHELVDQVRLRAKADGIPYHKLDKELGTGRYFQYGYLTRTRTVNVAAIVKAIEYFGGKLVIDWQDR